ncbi:dickkopf-related protein 4-like [Betta splendens]|uniref:Dickkopf-related protein 4-like n=1 Tax=Betta splendens TaxID=158456 RepID=A0A6P7NNR0_BETSP|nr:dickkopf-related protein 4-like [Betta splendens]
MTWAWRSVLCASVVCGLALDSNTIRSSKETVQQSSKQLNRSHGYQGERATRHRTEMNSNRRPTPACSTAECDVPQRGACSNRAQRRPSAQDRQVHNHREQRDSTSFNRTKAVEMSTCVRSRDCASGLCCARYLSRKVCLRVPSEGEACQLRGANKGDRKLGRCPCREGLSCSAAGRRHSGQGVCRSRPEQVQRKKKRRTAENHC